MSNAHADRVLYVAPADVPSCDVCDGSLANCESVSLAKRYGRRWANPALVHNGTCAASLKRQGWEEVPLAAAM